MRIHITGNAGAGKTSLARSLADPLDIPAFHLDQVVWQPYWKKSSVSSRTRALDQIIKPNDWIIEGVSEKVRSKADLVILLDVPRHVCFWRCAKRNIPYLFRSRPELPAHCPEILIVGRLLRIIWKFPELVGKRLLSEANGSNNIYVARNREQVDAILEEYIVEHVA